MTGRIAIVTGAGRGIGRATALSLAERGARVLGVSRTESELATLGLDYVVESVATLEGCRHVVAETHSRLGPVGILVANAGVGSGHERPIWEQDPAVWDETMAVNLDAVFHLVRLAVPDMIERSFGRIVVVSSTAGEVGGKAMSAYCASKAGVLGLVRAVAQDVAPHGITCNAVLPGWVRTEMAERSANLTAGRRGITAEEVWAERAAEYPGGRIPTAEEVAETIAFLASAEASGISGESITVALGGAW
jgi:NAD(P)-dependent dehydrogenase (short-subunit alcohol dehydrogenase family)